MYTSAVCVCSQNVIVVSLVVIPVLALCSQESSARIGTMVLNLFARKKPEDCPYNGSFVKLFVASIEAEINFFFKMRGSWFYSLE